MNVRKFLLVVTVLTVASLGLAACGGGGSAATPEPLNVTIHGKDIVFDITTLTAKVGQTVNITYINDGVLEHTFLIDGVVTDQKIAPGATTTFSFTAPAAGAYPYYCNVPGHEEAGMVGTLTVNP